MVTSSQKGTTMKLTPLQEATLNAMMMASGLAISAFIQDIIKRSEEVQDIRAGLKWRTSHKDRATLASTLTEARKINDQLSLIAALNETSLGISA